MSTAAYHSSFTPSQSDGDTLERLFVARDGLARALVEDIRSSATTGNKLQLLLQGPRGIGKTHLVALVLHRVRSDPALRQALCIAWLPEDPYVANYRDLLMEILRRVAEDDAQPVIEQALERLLDHPSPDAAAAEMEALLLASLGGRTLLVVMENLDDLLQTLGDLGQKQLRALVQNSGRIVLLATTTSLVEALADRRRIFFGFFKLSVLQPLTAAEATDMLAQLAERAGDVELQQALHSPMGRARVRAVHALANGNPRVYALFFDFLSRQALDDLVKPFMKLIDELTPYYQSRMSRLAPLQRRIIDVMRQLRGAATVKEIARRAMNSSQTISSQLGRLRELGYVVQADSLGRSNYYELREPLMRLCLEVKELRGRPVELFVEFLRVWHGEQELQRLAVAAPEGLDRSLFNAAAERTSREGDRVMGELQAELQRLLAAGQPEGALALADEALARAPDDRSLLMRRASLLDTLRRPPAERLAAWQRVSEAHPETTVAWSHQAVLLTDLGREAQALVPSQRALALEPEDAVLLSNHATLLARLGRFAEARELQARAFAAAGEPSGADEWVQRAIDLAEVERVEDAVDALLRALQLEPRSWAAWARLFSVLQADGRYPLQDGLLEALLEALPDDPTVRALWSRVPRARGRLDEALAALEPVARQPMLLAPELRPWMLLLHADVLGDLQRGEAALQALQAIEVPADDELFAFALDEARAAQLMWTERWADGLQAFDALLARATPAHWGWRGPDCVADLPVRTQNPAVWRRFIDAWITVFRRHGQLGALGKALVWRIRTLFRLPFVGIDTLRAWHACWAEAAAGVEELALPLRLLAAAVDYRAEADPRALLALPREERQLLEPWLQNLLRDRPDALDRRVLDALGPWRERLQAVLDAERRRAFWRDPLPAAATPDLDALTATLDDALPAGPWPQPLLPLPWERLPAAAAHRVLAQLAASDDTALRTLLRPGLRVRRVLQCRPAFSRWPLVQLLLDDGGRHAALDAVVGPDGACVLPGTSPPLHALADRGVFKVAGATARLQYLRFFCAALHDDDIRFVLVESADELRAPDGGPLPLPEGVAPAPLQPLEGAPRGSHRFGATLAYGTRLWRVVLELNRSLVTMLEDEPLTGPLPMLRETYDGPLRIVPAPGG